MQERVQAVELLAVNEDATAELYAAFAAKFPEQRKFWLQLVGEEKLHAHWVREFIEKIQRGEADIRPDRFNPQIYQTFLDYLHQCLTEAKQQPISFFAALSIAKDVENSMIEQVFFQVFEGDDPALKQVLRNLHNSTEVHRQHIEQMWNTARPTPLPKKPAHSDSD